MQADIPTRFDEDLAENMASSVHKVFLRVCSIGLIIFSLRSHRFSLKLFNSMFKNLSVQ